eukprot:COSAG06_NODE_12756_length_1334_cov_0.848583_2_plen_62_part_00
MNGCLHGRWVLGVAHDNPALPPTVVRTTRRRVFSCAILTCITAENDCVVTDNAICAGLRHR